MRFHHQRARLLAWSVHLFTASGSIVGFQALAAAWSGRPRDAVLWLVLAVAIDGIDGTFARCCRVAEVLPRMDGKMIDAVIDFLNFVVTPAVVLYNVKLVPAPFLFPSVAGILLASLYHIGNRDQLTPDNRIKGFPAWWNLVVYYLLVLELRGWINLAVVALFVALHFLPVRFIYLSRLQRHAGPAALAVVLLVAANVWLWMQAPHAGPVAKIAAAAPVVFLLLLGSVPNGAARGRAANRHTAAGPDRHAVP